MTAPLSLVPRPGPTPLVSVFAMSFDQGQFVPECLDSIVAQDYPRLEVLVVDHASSDPWSVEVTRAAAAERGLEFVALEDHGGPGPARNAAIARTRGELVLPVDADNVLLPGAVGRLVEQLLAAPDDVGFVYPRKLYRGRAPELPLPDYNLYELALGNFCDTGGLWDRRCFDPGPGFPPDGSLPHEDWHLALRLGLADVRGEPAREPTLLLRRQGFTRSQRSELDRERYERLRASFPELYAPEALAEVKREWAPAVSVVAPVPGGALAAQSCRDLERVEPGEEARGGIVLVAADGALLRRAETIEQLARTFDARPDLQALACFPGPDRYPLEPVREAPDEPAVAVAARAVALADAFGDEPIAADPHGLARTLADRLGAALDARWWPADGTASADGRRASAAEPREFRLAWGAPTPSARTTLEFCANATPLVPGADPPRGPLGPESLDRPIPPVGGRLLARWIHPNTAERRLAFADAPPPPSFLPERSLGWVWTGDRPGLVALRWGQEGMLEPCAGPGEAIAFVEPRDLQAFDELVVVRDERGRVTLAAGADDPLAGAVRERRLGWIEPPDRHPTVPARSTVTLGRRRLARVAGAERHGYLLDVEDEVGADLELGLLARRPPEAAVAFHPLLRAGRLAGLLAVGDDGPPARVDLSPRRHPRAALRWVLAPLRWRGRRDRLGLAGWRARRLLARSPAVSVGDEPVGWGWRDPAPDRIPLLGAWHPVTGDCLLSLHTAEARDWGYGEPVTLAFVEPAGPHRWGDLSRDRPWCSRRGREVQL